MTSELKDFLTSRRRRISPESVGRTRTATRRTDGLTREDMAELTGVSFKWYTLFESGAAKGVSRKLAERVAVVLKLSPAERHYLLGVLGFVDNAAVPPTAKIPSALSRLIHQTESVALVMHSPLFDVIDANASYRALFPPSQMASKYRDNQLWRLFMDPGYRSVWLDWESVAKRVLADFRYMTARLVRSPQYAALTKALGANADFMRLWNDERPAPMGEAGTRFELVTPDARITTVETVVLESTEVPGIYFLALLKA